jgi:hypothetical protein
MRKPRQSLELRQQVAEKKDGVSESKEEDAR